jgi:hypothetical protein
MPFATGRLEVTPATEIYWETSGVRDGAPLLYLHGGPESGLGSRGWRATYDTGRHLVVAGPRRAQRAEASRPPAVGARRDSQPKSATLLAWITPGL